MLSSALTAALLAAALQPPISSSSATQLHRRHVLSAAGLAVSVSPLVRLRAARAEEVASISTGAGASATALPLAELADKEFGYRLEYPADWKAAGKPVKTHLHEALLSSPGGLKLGVTIDPVVIDSLEAFGTLDQVTERVLAVETTRDGVNSVTLRTNAAQAADAARRMPSYYTIEYATDSSRGKKLFSCKYCIAGRRLYVLQLQAKLDDFDGDEAVRAQVRSIVGSFEVVVAS
jgi:hypothetical protein